MRRWNFSSLGSNEQQNKKMLWLVMCLGMRYLQYCAVTGEAIWDWAALGHVASVTAPAVADKDGVPPFSKTTARSSLCCRMGPVRCRLFAPTLTAGDGKPFVQFRPQRRSAVEHGHLLARTRAVTLVLICHVGSTYWVSGRAAGLSLGGNLTLLEVMWGSTTAVRPSQTSLG